MKKKPIRILIMMDQLFGSTGGSEQHISFLQKNLPQNKFKIIFVLLRDTGFYDPETFPVNPIFLNFTSFLSPYQTINAVKKIIQLIRSLNIDIIHTFFPDSEIIAMIASKFCRSLPIICARRNMGYWQSNFTRERLRITNSFVTKFIANSMAVKEQLNTKEHIKKCKIEVIYNPILVERFDNKKLNRKFLLNFDVRQSDLIVGIVANLRPIKDHATFLKSARFVLEKFNNVKFILIGEGKKSYTKYLKAYACELGIDSSTIFLEKFLSCTDYEIIRYRCIV